MSRGFSLIQISVLLTVASLVMVACLPLTRNNTVAAGTTTARMNTVLVALRQFELRNARLPCPADAVQPQGSALYGVEAANAASGNCTGGSPAATLVDASNHVALGMVPVRALGLSADYAQDGWGRQLTYAVDTGATGCFLTPLPGALTVTDNGGASGAVAVLVSHGANGHGAWNPLTGAAGTVKRINAGSTDADELTNAHLDATFTPTLPLTGFVRHPPSATFDDLVVYRNQGWNLNTLPAAAAVTYPTLTGPANATYITGETLAFALAYPSTVTVTGSPELTLTVGATTRYAAYSGGSGTANLNFSYTVQAGDYAPGGIGVASAVTMNGGAIGYPCNSFPPPTLAGVQVKKLYAYVTDYNNNRIETFDADGNYLSKFGGSGILSGLFSHPDQLAFDATGNVWVSDWGNARVQGFSAAGGYIGQFGSLGIGNGQFLNPSSMAVDSSGNFWVVDTGNSRVQKFSSAGVYAGKFGSVGLGNGQFVTPNGLALDASGNLWVGDTGNNRLQKFSAAGVYIAKFGSFGTGTGRFNAPCGQAIDALGNLWVVDSGNARVEEFDASGNYLAQFGSLGTGNGQFAAPCGIAIDLAGNAWVGDGGNNRVQKFSSAGAYLLQFGSAGIGNGQFLTPAGIALGYQ